MNYASIIKEVGRGARAPRDLDATTAERLFGAMLDGAVPALELGALLIAYRIKGEATAELVGFQRALQARLARLRVPGSGRVLVLPSYNGARKQANLLPLLAMAASRCGLPVLIHGVVDDYGRTTSAAILQALGIDVCLSIAATEAGLDSGRPVFVAIECLSPGLAALLASRARLGVRSSAHTIAKLADPFDGRSLRMISVTHPDYLERMRTFLVGTDGHALLMRGTEGEPVAPVGRRPQIEWFHDGRGDVLVSQETMAPPERLPEGIDAAGTARWIERVLAGGETIPASLCEQLACCLLAAGTVGDLDVARARVRTVLKPRD